MGKPKGEKTTHIRIPWTAHEALLDLSKRSGQPVKKLFRRMLVLLAKDPVIVELIKQQEEVRQGQDNLERLIEKLTE